MIEILYILFGWVLGLVSPIIIQKIQSKRDQKVFLSALKKELNELILRVCMTGYILGQKYGCMDKEYLIYVQRIFEEYEGEERVDNAKKVISILIEADEEIFKSMLVKMRAQEGMALSLKTFPTYLLDSSSQQLANLPLSVQPDIYALKNALHIFNEEISSAKEYFWKTFDSSVNDESHQVVLSELVLKYELLQKMSVRVCQKIEPILKV